MADRVSNLRGNQKGNPSGPALAYERASTALARVTSSDRYDRKSTIEREGGGKRRERERERDRLERWREI